MSKDVQEILNNNLNKKSFKDIEKIAQDCNEYYLCLRVADGYYFGLYGANKDYDKAFEFYSLSLRSKKTDRAFLGLGRCYEFGNGVKQDFEVSLKLYQEAYELNPDSRDAQLGIERYNERNKRLNEAKELYQLGILSQQNNNLLAARQYFEQSQKLGYDAALALGWVDYSEGKFDWAKARWEKLAKLNNPDAFAALSTLYNEIFSDYAQAYNYCKLAADNGHRQAMFKISDNAAFNNNPLEYFAYGAFAKYAFATFEKEGWDYIISPEVAFKYCKLAADQGDKEAMLELADAYKNGLGTEVNFKEAFKYKAAAQYVSSPGMYGRVDEDEAFDACKKEADSGDQEAIYDLKMAYENGYGDNPPNPKEAFKYKYVLYALNFSENPNDINIDFDTAFECCRNIAKTSDPEMTNEKLEAMYDLSLACAQGYDGSQPKLEVAAELCQLAAEGGHKDAMLKMSAIYESGDWNQEIDIEKAFTYRVFANYALDALKEKDLDFDINLPQALEYCEVYAGYQNPQANYDMSVAYKNGFGCAADAKKSFKYSVRAVNAGYNEALLDLAHAYENGLGVAVNPELAFIYRCLEKYSANQNFTCGNNMNAILAFNYCKAKAACGDEQAMHDLSIAYENGWGATKDPVEAFKYKVFAHYVAPELYQNGIDLQSALEHCKLAADSGDEKARCELADVQMYLQSESSPTVFLLPQEKEDGEFLDILQAYEHSKNSTAFIMQMARDPKQVKLLGMKDDSGKYLINVKKNPENSKLHEAVINIIEAMKQNVLPRVTDPKDNMIADLIEFSGRLSDESMQHIQKSLAEIPNWDYKNSTAYQKLEALIAKPNTVFELSKTVRQAEKSMCRGA